MKYLANVLLLIAATVVFSNFATGGVIYDESVSGDLAAFDSRVFTLEIGENSVLGSSINSINNLGDFDGFNVFLGAGLRLLNVEYFVLGTDFLPGSPPTELRAAYELRDGSYFGSSFGDQFLEIDATLNPQSFLPGEFPISGERTLAFRPGTFSRAGLGGTWDYEFRLTTTTAVPAPATLALLSLGLLGLRFRRKVMSLRPS